jgi:hypothetical protein
MLGLKDTLDFPILCLWDTPKVHATPLLIFPYSLGQL